MKKTLPLVLVTIIATIFLAMAASAELVPQGNSLEVELLTYTPVPAQPGDLIEVWVQINNEGNAPSDRGEVIFLDSFPFTVENPSDKEKSFSSVPPQRQFLIKTTVRVDKNANAGTNYLHVMLRQDGSESWSEYSLPITIQGQTSALTILSATSTPERIAPGSEGKLELVVQNTGSVKLRNVEVALTLDELSIAPTGSSNTKTIDSLAGGETATFTFELVAFPAAAANAYQVPVTLSYTDEQDNALSQEKTIGLIIASEPELLVYLDKNEVSTATMSGDVVIRFTNKGLNEIKLLEMTIPENDEVEVLSESNVVYIGNIDADDYESTDISLKLKSGSAADLPIEVSYRDALNQLHEESFTLHINTQSENGKSSLGWVTWLIIIVIVIALIWFFVRRSRKKKLKNDRR